MSHIRSIAREELPDAVECITYGIPMVKHHGMVLGFAAFKNHLSIFPGHTVADFADELSNFKISKGTVQFTPNHPISDDLLRRIIRRRADENVASKE